MRDWQAGSPAYIENVNLEDCWEVFQVQVSIRSPGKVFRRMPGKVSELEAQIYFNCYPTLDTCNTIGTQR